MRKGHSLSALLIAVLFVIFAPSIEAAPSGLVASAAPSFHGSANNMLQFKAWGHLLGFQPGKVYLASLDHALSVEFLGTPGVMPKAVARGKEMGKVPSLGRVFYESLWEGISLTYEAREGDIAESTYHIGPWTDVSKIRLGYNVPVEVQRDGSLRFKFDHGYLTESSPEAWQEIGGERVPVEVAFRVTGGEVGFSVGPYDPNYPLTIDPTYVWHAFYGSTIGDPNLYDSGNAIATDGSGNVYVTGDSNATWNGPAGQSPLHAHSGGSDIFVLKLSSSGAYQWHTFYGATDPNVSYGITADGSGNVYITGASFETSWNGPAGQSPLHAHNSANDIFVLKLNSSGAYQWHTFYGSSYGDQGNAVAVDGSGNVYVTGTSTYNWNGPTDESPLHAHSTGSNIVVLKLNSSGAYQWHTFYSENTSHGSGIATDGTGNLYVLGDSSITWNGPAGESPLHAAHTGGSDIFVLKLNSSGAYQWHTFYGSGADTNWDWGKGIVTDGSGNIYVTGLSNATWDGPGLGMKTVPPLHAHSGGSDIFVLKLSDSGAYQWHTFFYGPSLPSLLQMGKTIATDGSGNVYVTGESDATWNGPAGQSPRHAWSGYFDILVLKLNSSGAYQWHTFYGSGVLDRGFGIAADGSGNVYVTGDSGATWNGPAGQSPLHAYSGGVDIFVLKLSDVPPSKTSRDFDGDGKTDVAVYRTGTGAWYIYPSGGTAPYGVGWGISTDKSVPGDYDADGKTDIAVYRGSTGAWFLIPSSGATPYGFGWGGDASDKPVPEDYDGDGKTDYAVYRGGVWFISPSGGGSAYAIGWGIAGDKPVPGDYDGDAKTDLAIYRDGVWFIYPSGGETSYAVGWGIAADKPVPGDYDGDGKADVAIYREGLWFIYPSGGETPYAVGWGIAADKPVAGDYDGDGRTDIAVYRSSTGAWYVIPSGGGVPYGLGWGGDVSDVPLTANPD